MLYEHLAAVPAAFLLLGALASADVQEVPLEFHESADVQGTVPYGSADSMPLEECPPGDWKLPELVGKKPMYGLLELGDSKYLFVMDAREAGGEICERFFLDQNGDGDLTNDPVMQAEAEEVIPGYWMAEIEETVVLDYELDGVRLPYVVRVGIQSNDMEVLMGDIPEEMRAEMDFEVSWYANISTACLYSGAFELDGVKYRIMLGDTDGDGRFGERVFVDDSIRYSGGGLYPQGDQFFLTAREDFTYQDAVILGDLLLLGDDVFGVEVNVPDHKLVLTPITDGLSRLKLSHPPQQMLLHSKDFEHSVMLVDTGSEVRVPAGEYRLLSYTMTREGEHGDVWRVGATATKDSPFVTVAPGGEAELPFGEPFTVTTDVASWSLQQWRIGSQPSLQLSFAIRGSAHESVNDLARVSGMKSACAMSKSDQSLPVEPTYTIVKASGELVEQGSFEYG